MDISAILVKQVKSFSVGNLLRVVFLAIALLLIATLGVSIINGISSDELAMNEKAKENRFSIQLLHPSAYKSLTETQRTESIRLITDNLNMLSATTRSSDQVQAAVKEAHSLWENYNRKYIKNNGLESEARTDFVNLSAAITSVAKLTGEELSAASFRQQIYTAICLTIILIILGAGFMLVHNNIIRPVNKLTGATSKVAKGKFGDTITVNSGNELSRIAGDINILANTLQNADTFTHEIGSGNLEVSYPGIENEKEAIHLAASLLEMRHNMKQSAEEGRQRRWITEGLARFSEILRTNNSDLKSMAGEVVSSLVKYLEANQGAFFVVDGDADTEQTLILRAAYAFDRQKFISKEVKKGQGLIGQAFVEQETIYLTEVPDDYLDIRSGLGDAGPKSVLIIPLKVNGEIHGVIEIASFTKIPSYRREFAEKVGETIASTISTVKINEQTSLLYRESQEMTEQLRAQEEEMRQNMEEMQATQEEMRRTQQELSKKEANQSALINNTTDSIVTVDREYKIMVINKVLRDRYKGTNYEGMDTGKNVLDYLGDVRDEWKTYYDRALGGERLQFTIKSTVSGEHSYREYNIYPIKVGGGEIAGASVFSRDVTEQKLTELRSKEVVKELQHKDRLFINSFYFMELDYQFNVVTINDHFCEVLGIKGDEISGRSID
ncbi:MAG: GAF domain-containing protein, partial [Cyclobacteriaceae bacterium]